MYISISSIYPFISMSISIVYDTLIYYIFCDISKKGTQTLSLYIYNIYIYIPIIYIYIHIYTYVYNNISLCFHFIYLALLLRVYHLIDIIITIDKNREVMLKLSCIKFKAKLKTESVLKDHGVVILSFSGNSTVRRNMVRNIKLILHQE